MTGCHSPARLFTFDMPLVQALREWIEAERSVEEVERIIIRHDTSPGEASFEELYRCTVVYTDEDRQTKRFYEDGTELTEWDF